MITTVARKLRVPAATTVVVLNRPAGIDLDFPADCLVLSDPATAEAADAEPPPPASRSTIAAHTLGAGSLVRA